jgi:hypothetical protein
MKILVIPDTAEMGWVIDFHAQEHKKAQNSREREKIFNHIKDLLIKQVLKKATKQSHKKFIP